MNKGFAPIAVIVTLVVIIGGAIGYTFLTKKNSSEVVPMNAVTETSSKPTCSITTALTKVVSTQDTIPFSWTSTGADKVSTDFPVAGYSGYDLPPSGSGSVKAEELTVSKPGGTTPDSVSYRFTVSNKNGTGACWLTLPYEPKKVVVSKATTETIRGEFTYNTMRSIAGRFYLSNATDTYIAFRNEKEALGMFGINVNALSGDSCGWKVSATIEVDGKRLEQFDNMPATVATLLKVTSKGTTKNSCF